MEIELSHLLLASLKPPKEPILGKDLKKIGLLLKKAYPVMRFKNNRTSPPADRLDQISWASFDITKLHFGLDQPTRNKVGSEGTITYYWKVCILSGDVTYFGIHRPPQRTAKPVPTQPLVAALLPFIRRRKWHPALLWRNKERTFASLLPGQMVPSAPSWRTTTDRERRFRRALSDALEPLGWELFRGFVRRKMSTN